MLESNGSAERYSSKLAHKIGISLSDTFFVAHAYIIFCSLTKSQDKANLTVKVNLAILVTKDIAPGNSSQDVKKRQQMRIS